MYIRHLISLALATMVLGTTIAETNMGTGETLENGVTAENAEGHRVDDAEEEKKRADGDDSDDPRSVVERLTELLPINIYAFGDFYYAKRENGDDQFEIGQLEVDLEQTLVDHLVIATGVAYDGETGNLGIGSFTIDGHFAGKSDDHLIHSDAIETSGIMFGQFDVPFGIAYLEYPSVDRWFVTTPLAVDETHEQWNDLGGQVYLDSADVNFVFFVVNGYQYELDGENDEIKPAGSSVRLAPRPVGGAAFNTAGGLPSITGFADGAVGAANGEDPASDVDLALGGRFGWSPTGFAEIGGSVAGFLNEDNDWDMMLSGVDLQVDPSPRLDFRGEYIFCRKGMTLEDDVRDDAYYAQGRYYFDPFYLLGRYSESHTEMGIDIKRVSGCFGVKVHQLADIRLEYSRDLDSGESMVYFQLVGGSSFQPTGLRR